MVLVLVLHGYSITFKLLRCYNIKIISAQKAGFK